MTHDLEEAILSRRSIRRFLRDRPVPRDVLSECLTLAQSSPSNSNIQPWRLFIATDASRDRLRDELWAVAGGGREPPNIPLLPPSFQHHRIDLGAVVYGSMGIARSDKEGRRAAVMRNYEFFGAPVVGIVCIHRDLGQADTLSVGMYLQTLVLCLTARGIGTCVQVSLAGYPDVIRRVLNIPSELEVICGISIGYPDPDFPANQLKIGRDSAEEHVTFMEA